MFSIFVEAPYTVGKIYGALLMYEHWRAYKSRKEGKPGALTASRQATNSHVSATNSRQRQQESNQQLNSK